MVRSVVMADGEPRGIYGWTLRPAAGAPCAGCGAVVRRVYQLQQLVAGGWSDVVGERWCVRCWTERAVLDPQLRRRGWPPEAA